jgi:hypothetical protein
MKTKIILSAIAALIIAAPAFATPDCPTPESVVPVGLNVAMIIQGSWVATYSPKYEYTKGVEWNFLIGSQSTGHDDMTADEALARGREFLPTIKLVDKEDYDPYTICLYSTSDDDVVAAAVTPASDSPLGMMKFIKN